MMTWGDDDDDDVTATVNCIVQHCGPTTVVKLDG